MEFYKIEHLKSFLISNNLEHYLLHLVQNKAIKNKTSCLTVYGIIW